ncbi:hypothetical protein [Streptomyces sp. RKAG290]|uniref:hypothetical protein n=1 Tax=Streptomyces sp. RKAG290 TaxID=2888348 RepID=UPI0020334B8B|nr:hypothetical protein [Streptomyces sp. RKAG290]MCM2416115.1 hypothetical protein [Streptomyces sp. RKAG290]
MTDIDTTRLDELADSWDEIREDYQDSHNDEYDQAVLDCATRLAADPGGASAPVWTLGLVVMAPTSPGCRARVSRRRPWQL